MYYLPDVPLTPDPLPAGLSISRFDGSEKDIHAWADCLRNGNLIEGRTDEKAFAEVCEGLSSLVVGAGFLPDDVSAVGLDIPKMLRDVTTGGLATLTLSQSGMGLAEKQRSTERSASMRESSAFVPSLRVTRTPGWSRRKALSTPGRIMVRK